MQTIYWRNKLSEENYGLKNIGFFRELEVFEIALHMKAIDKRLLRAIDRAIPYYIFHITVWNGQYQALVSDKQSYRGKIKLIGEVDNMLGLPQQSLINVSLNKNFTIIFPFHRR